MEYADGSLSWLSKVVEHEEGDQRPGDHAGSGGVAQLLERRPASGSARRLVSALPSVAARVTLHLSHSTMKLLDVCLQLKNCQTKLFVEGEHLLLLLLLLLWMEHSLPT